MLKEMLEYVVGESQPRLTEVGGFTYTSKTLKLVTTPPISPITVFSLQGVVDYLGSGEMQSLQPRIVTPGPIECPKIFVHVVSSMEVTVMTLLGKDNTRDTVIQAKHKNSTTFPIGKWMLPEEFIVEFKTNAIAPIVPISAENEMSHYNQILSIASSISNEHIQTMKDDGISQSVATKQGVNFDMTTILPFYDLNFRRSFPEIYQPSSRFFLRVRGDEERTKKVLIALHECTRDDWELRARDRVKSWLKENIHDDMVVILD